MCIYSCMAHQIKDAHPRRQGDYVGPTCVQDVRYITVWFSLFASFYSFYAINGSGQCRKCLGESLRMVAYGGS